MAYDLGEARKRWIEQHPQAHRAHVIVATAIKRKKLVAQACERCGNPVATAHHDDYTKPLDVRWLCAACHRKHHAALAPKRERKPRGPQKPRTRHRVKRPRNYPKHSLLPQATAMRAQGMLYSDIAKALGVSQSTVYKWINPGRGYK